MVGDSNDKPKAMRSRSVARSQCWTTESIRTRSLSAPDVNSTGNILPWKKACCGIPTWVHPHLSGLRQRLHWDGSEKNFFKNVYSVHQILQHLHWFILYMYARNRLNEYSNTGSLVSVGRGLRKTVKITRRIRFLPVSNHSCLLHMENKRCEVVPFSNYMLL